MSEPKWTPGPWLMVEPVAIDYRAPLIYGANGSSLVAVAEGGGPKRGVSAAEARTNARLIATAPTLYSVADTAPVLSKYHGQHGFEVERFIADYEVWSATRRAAMVSTMLIRLTPTNASGSI